jgi:uroporphyrin-III C-methyltransferase
MNNSGFVFIVGAGPGDPDLITVKGLRSLRQADVVLHDRLVDTRLLREVRPDAKIIDVGKRKGSEDQIQERIHALMVKYALAGNIVCRLKGGDPFVFGRAAEEIHALNGAGVPFEVVPGLSSVTAGPTSAGISLTERGSAHGFMVIAGSRSLQFDSVVVMMGLARAAAISESLIAHTIDADIPAAVISRATWSDQETRLGTLRTIAQQAEGLPTPAILVLGKLIDLGQLRSRFANQDEVGVGVFEEG